MHRQLPLVHITVSNWSREASDFNAYYLQFFFNAGGVRTGRQGYGDRHLPDFTSSSRPRQTVLSELQAMGVSMEDVGKNVMANMNMSVMSPPCSTCAKLMAGEGSTLAEVQYL